ncbi:MAG TPA: phosphatidylglycerol lysyltransferase domain-containing protein [Gaiellaceae bacterium]|nr:phosphatidylglycerol lysyltransferase domain-containing protein [Gaiellaceae bacterium]
MSSPSTDPAALLALHGRNPFSFFVRYDAPWQWLPLDGGAAPYLEHGRAVVLWGDPLTSSDGHLGELTRALRGRRICLLLIGEELARTALAHGYGVLKIGEQPYFDLRTWNTPRGDPGKRLRWVLNRARRAGVETRAYEPDDAAAVEEAVDAWQSGLGRAAAGSFLRASPLVLAGEKRLFLALANGRLEALVSCAPLPAVDGWLLEDLIRRPDAPMGATEAVVVHALQELAAAGAARAWLDLAPLRGFETQLDRRARLIFRGVGPLVRLFDARYRFRALTTYLDKFEPTGWTPRYVALKPFLPTPSLVRALTTLL